MTNLLRRFFNFYLVIKNCWVVILFLGVGFFAFAVFAQGLDILKTLGFDTGNPSTHRHTWFALFGVNWWAWQNWRAARITLHFSNFRFWGFHPRFTLNDQIYIPRILGVFPFIILGMGIHNANENFSTLEFILYSNALWFYVFLHLRKQIVVFLRRRGFIDRIFKPDYIQVKNNIYPADFIFSKQWKWILTRFATVCLLFALILKYPVSFSNYMGSPGIVIFGLGSWIVMGSLLNFTEKYIRFPVVITLIVCAFIFSFFNNNHAIRMAEKIAPDSRPDIYEHFTHWTEKHPKDLDTLPIFLIASEGGGIRAAYWSSSVLGMLTDSVPGFSNYVYGISGVSGGALGAAVYTSLIYSGQQKDVLKASRVILNNDFLAPVTAWFVFPDLVQRFLPFKINSIDRAKALEYSFEQAWYKNYGFEKSREIFKNGLLTQYQGEDAIRVPSLFLNSTHVETGNRVLLSNIKSTPGLFFQANDLFKITGKDIPLSTAVGLSSRFPFLTPPGLVKNEENEEWGSVVDGGYYENMGGTTILEVYDKIREVLNRKNIPSKISIFLIRNTLNIKETPPLKGLHEIAAPLVTYGNVWIKSGNFGLHQTEKLLLNQADKIININLERHEGDNLPLGWTLSPQSIKSIDFQVENNYSGLIKMVRGDVSRN